jgi:hypothetical protein
MTFPAWRISAQWGARARWMSHLIDHLGNPTRELTPPVGLALPDRPDFRIAEFGPGLDRPYVTYMTAGLSLVPQAADGPMPHVELSAYTAAPDLVAAEMLFRLAYDIATTTADEPAYKAWDLWRAEVHGYRDFMIAVARESDDLLDFPNVSRRKDDERYLLAAIGELTGTMYLDLLQLVPLTIAEWEIAARAGVGTLLEALRWDDQPRMFGWAVR